jgi:cytochrome c5
VQEVELPAVPNGAPMTYMANGKQYISVAVGGSTDAKLITLAIGGKVKVKKKVMTAEDKLRRPGPLRAATLYGQACANCHENAVHGAPKPGDKAAWRSRLSEGVEKLYLTTISGLGEMPARGGCGDCTDGDLMSLVDSMIGGAK